jgi:hypothetical protein
LSKDKQKQREAKNPVHNAVRTPCILILRYAKIIKEISSAKNFGNIFLDVIILRSKKRSNKELNEFKISY